ncbi:hypothetical protein OTU49_005721, partial [Cherax quadricarinatus]
ESDLTTPISSWVPTDCHIPRHYACEVPAGQPVILIPPSNERYCPEGWEKESDHCYMFSTQEMSWSAAASSCASQDSSLVSILSWREQDFVKLYQQGGSWIGLNDRKTENAWIWSDGSSVTITNWNVGEPTGGGENCAQMLADTGKWNDIPCDLQLVFSCKKKASSTPIGTLTTTTAEPDTSACGIDWTENPVTGECYRLELEELSFADARSHCTELFYYSGQSKPDLISIYSSQEQTFVYDLVTRQHLSQTSLWLGMKNDVDGARWMDGTPAAYFNWDDGEPNGYFTENCIVMYLESGKWNDNVCDLRAAFICEKKGTNYVGPQPPPPPAVTCPEGWSYWNNHCYFFSDTTTDWDSAHDACNNNMGSELVSIASEDEDNYLASVLSSAYKLAWIGLHDDNNGANWHWVDGTPLDYTNWYYTEPNDQDGNEHCAEKRYDYGNQWNDMRCSETNYYICKITVTTCPQTWAYKNGKCYFASDFEITWNEARDKCKEYNTEADLVSIHSDEENAFFTEQLTHKSDATWLGLSYNQISDQWIWSDGQVNNYTNWNEGEPNSDTENCVECIDYPTDPAHGKWNNLDCTASRAFACELFPTHTVGCEEGWFNFDNYCYWASDSYNWVSFSSARADCQSKGGDLASIHSAEENDYIVSQVNSDYYYNTYWWIGMTDSGHEGTYQWSDGTSVTYTNWDILSYYSFRGESNCALLGDNFGDNLWSLDLCDSYNSYVCKKPQESTPITPSQDGCNTDDAAYKGSCYNLPDMEYSWSDAKAYCESHSAHLLVLNDRYESAFVSAMLGDLDSWAWLGLSGAVGDDGAITFSWVNADPVDFTNWDEFEPDASHGLCVMASGKKSNPGLWIVRSCDNTYNFLCEYDRSGYTTPPVPTTLAPSDFCAYGWTLKDEHCYQVVSDAMSWGQGEEFCMSMGGHLASVGSAEEETIIQQLPGMSDHTFYKSVWVGLRMGSESGFEWSDGTAFDYVNWDEDQPDNHYERENCVSANMLTMKLSDSVCGAYFPFICEAPQGMMVTTLAPPTRGPDILCDEDPSWYLHGDYCYQFNSVSDEDPQTWWESHIFCRNEGAELASIHTFDDNYWIESKIYNMSDNMFWIGGQASLDSGYMWIDETAFDFDNWAKGEPNNEYDQEDCISMYNHQQGYWNDANCAHTMGCICRKLHGQTFPPPKTTKIPDGHCPDGWLHTGRKCIKSFKDKMNFTSARSSCKALDDKADLVSIHSSAEQAYLTALLGSIQEEVWLGMQYMGEFLWLDQSSLSYTNWSPGEPSGGPDWNLCVQASPATGQWNDVFCFGEYSYICMMNQDPNVFDHHPPPTCHPPFNEYLAYNDACYKPMNTTKSWQEAESACVNEGAHLASVHDLSEDALMWVLTQESAVDDAWLGFNNLQSQQVYKWCDGWPTMYTNWDRDQPNATSSDNNCVRVNVHNGRWSAENCEEVRPFICKFYNGTVPTPDPPIIGHCPDSRWLDLGGGYCYLIITDLKSWSDANMGCLQEDASLASIHSEEEMKLITMAVKNYQLPFWIGLVQKAYGDFGWSDGSGFDFFNWQSGQPNSDEEQCTEISPTSGLWNDAVCSNIRFSICKILKIQDEKPTKPVPTGSVTTNSPHGGNGKLDAGGIIGIIVAVLFVMVAVGFVGYNLVQRQPKPVENHENLSFSYVTSSQGKRGGHINVNVPNEGSDA